MSLSSPYARPRSLFLLFLATLLGPPLTFATPIVALADVAAGGNAVVITTEGDSLTVRSGPGRQFPSIGALAQGTVVAVLAGPQTSDDGSAWMQVQGGGLTGWCAAEWLADAAAAPASSAPAVPPTASAPSVAPTPAPITPSDPGSTLNGGGSPRISGTGGSGARLRATPSLNGDIVTVVPEGAEVIVTGDPVNAEGYAWVPVTYLGMAGWVASGLLSAATAPVASPSPTPSIVPLAAPLPTATPAITPTPAVAPAIAPLPTATPTTSPSNIPATGAAGLVIGGNATIVGTDGLSLRIRSRPGLDAPIVAFAPPGAVVAITDEPQADSTGAPWYGIAYNGSRGWVLGEHLAPLTGITASPAATPPPPSASPTPAPTPIASPAPSVTPSTTPNTAAAPSGNRGQAIAALALRYLGVPYVYGGTTPAGWDCSGFVAYIYKNAAGITLPRSAAQQYRVGTSIGAAQVQAGDIVFFADTFGPGITHNGLALGDGRFIHARSEGYGTVISSLSDPYWAQHYVGAQRP